ncbi:MAG TPA: glycine betaine ABC transporter substrate-binding protein, partial [Burkholderiales bacterium]|nr:glycine betaine ABC transporter substrate-binding protein [Burkholderiales bacterium]
MRLILGLALAAAGVASAADGPTVGSKRFTESYLLGEILAQVSGGRHKPGLGNTAILVEALRNGAIDVYPEYTGTIAREVLKSEERLDLSALNERLKPSGLAAGFPLGFSNSYALGMRRADAEKLAIRRISDLRTHSTLRVGLSHEFLGRGDGWPGLQAAYGLPQAPRGLVHGLAYEVL